MITSFTLASPTDDNIFWNECIQVGDGIRPFCGLMESVYLYMTIVGPYSMMQGSEIY